MYKGIGGSAGYGVGRAVIIGSEMPVYEKKHITDIDGEKERLQSAFSAFIDKTRAMAAAMKESVGEENTAILEGHIMMLEDPYMQEEIMSRVDAGICAESAVEEACDTFIEMFSMTGDELTMQRATDIRDIKIRLIKLLTKTPDINISQVPKGTILVARDLTPSMTAGIVKENVEGIVTELGGLTSHSAILARALEIPAVLGIEGVTGLVKDGMLLAVDGCEGILETEPNQAVINDYGGKRENYLREKEALKAYAGKPTVTADGIAAELYANIGRPSEASKALESGAEGIGLFRTEFLFMDSDRLPEEEEQYQAYRQAVNDMGGREVIIRTLDIGGDKDIPYMGLEKEDNPFLGYRAVRYCLGNRSLYRKQLRSLLRASAHGPLKIMVPLVTTVSELREVKAILEELKKELDKEEVAYDRDIRVGVMIETPAASEIADLLAKEADFFSIGTNDLTQYTMAVDRGNAKTAYLYSSFQPSVLRSVKRIITAAKAAGIKVGMCGEAAADKRLTPLLIAFGLDEYSVSPSSVLETRASIAKWSKAEAVQVADKVMSMSEAEEIQAYLESVKR